MPAIGTDLRLVPAALSAWLTALVIVALPAGTVLVLAGAAAGLGLVAALTGVGSRRGPASPALGQVVLIFVTVAVVAFAGAVQVDARRSGLLAGLVEQGATVHLVGRVRSAPVPLAAPAGWGGAAARFRLELAVEHVSGRGRAGAAAAPVLVLAGPAWARVAYGARVEATGTLAPTARGDVMLGLLTARGAPRSVAPPGASDRTVGRIWAALLAVTDNLAPDPRGLVPGIAVGDTSRLPADLRDAMRVAGLTHVTAVSGAHFAIIGASVLGLTGLVGLPRRARIAVVVAAMAGVVLLVHAEPSVLRAAAMGAVGIGGMLLGRPSRALPALGATVIVLLVVDPWLGRSFGFALSVLATAGIVVLTEPITRRLARLVPGRLGYAIAVPFAAQTACAPVIVLLNPALATYAVAANLAVAPALAPATVLGVLAALVAPWWPAAGAVLGGLAGWAAWWIAQVARVCARLPAAQLPWPGGPGGAVALAGVTLAIGLALSGRGRRQQPRRGRGPRRG